MMLRLGAAICGTAIQLACSPVAVAETSRGDDVSRNGASMVGAASMYDPNHPGYREGGQELANGERYDPSAWAAAIQTDLRGKFGGVHHGSRAAYALVESSGKKAVIKINDVGPLKPGRIIDFNRQAMRYFDPSLQRGVIQGVKVTPLDGDHWTPGPVAREQTSGVTSAAVPCGPRRFVITEIELCLNRSNTAQVDERSSPSFIASLFMRGPLHLELQQSHHNICLRVTCPNLTADVTASAIAAVARSRPATPEQRPAEQPPVIRRPPEWLQFPQPLSGNTARS